MNNTTSDVLAFLKENDVKFIRLSFCDLFGSHKNIAIMADELEPAFENGVSFDPHAISGFGGAAQSDLLLFPDPATIIVLPWRPGPGRVVRFYCDIKNPDGSEFSSDSRLILKRVIRRAEEKGCSCKIGVKCEFYLFKTNEDGSPINITLDSGGYLDISPLDKGEDMRREICLTLEEMGIRPKTSHHERGPGQNEIDFNFSDALACADNFQTFKSVVKAIAERNGLYASFMPKPLLDNAGSALHINLSLSHNGHTVFTNVGGEQLGIAENFTAGLLSKTPEITLFLNPLANSYERFGEAEAPKYVSWSRRNNSQLIRFTAAGEKTGIELRSPDPSLNPYLAFALIIAAGLDGIENNTPLPPAVDEDLHNTGEAMTKTLTSLPGSLDAAIALTEKSGFVKGVTGEQFLSNYLAIKKTEAADFAASGDKAGYYRDRYFSVI